MGTRTEELNRPKVIVVMPAYNAAKTLKITYEAIPHQTVDQVIEFGSFNRGGEAILELSCQSKSRNSVAFVREILEAA